MGTVNNRLLLGRTHGGKDLHGLYILSQSHPQTHGYFGTKEGLDIVLHLHPALSE